MLARSCADFKSCSWGIWNTAVRKAWDPVSSFVFTDLSKKIPILIMALSSSEGDLLTNLLVVKGAVERQMRS